MPILGDLGCTSLGEFGTEFIGEIISGIGGELVHRNYSVEQLFCFPVL